MSAEFKMRPRHEQLALKARTWGGKRDGAGRKPNPGRRSVPHSRRSPHDPRCPAHVTLRAGADVPSLRDERLLPFLRTAFRAASNDRFRLLAFSIQADHLHLLVEADGPTGLARGMQGLAIHVARAVNRALARHGSSWSERYHARMLRTPSEVRSAFVYVLNNFRKHVRAASGLDPYSSARWFGGWAVPVRAAAVASPVAAARTWLARVGWRRAGPIHPAQSPRPHRRRRRRGPTVPTVRRW